jgi:hypothetical protein
MMKRWLPTTSEYCWWKLRDRPADIMIPTVSTELLESSREKLNLEKPFNVPRILNSPFSNDHQKRVTRTENLTVHYAKFED